MDVDYLYLIIVFQMLAQFGDIHIHRTSIEIVVVYPDGLQSKIALEYLVAVGAEQGQQFVLLGSEFGLLVTDGEQLLLGVEHEAAETIEGRLLALLAAHTTQDGLNAEHKLLHRERLGDIVVGTNLEPFEYIVLQGLGREEDDGY